MGGPPALEGITVLELPSGIPGAYCGRLLAMVGADVVKVDVAGRPDAARTAGDGGDRVLHAQKRSLAIDLRTPDGPALLDRLVAAADVVLDDDALGAPPAVRARYDAVLARPPPIVLPSFSPLRARRPSRRLGVDELAELAAGGFLPEGPGRGPAVMPGVPSAHCSVGTVGAVGVLLAPPPVSRDGGGQLVEVAVQEVLVDLLAAPTVVHSFAGADMPRLGDNYPFGIYRCADGYLGVNILHQSDA